MTTKAMQWIAGDDVGTSSKTIWAVMMGAVSVGQRYDRPYDGGDFGRCHRLLALVPDWRHRLDEVSALFPEWGPIVRDWPKIEAAYIADAVDNGGRTYAIINALNDECMAAGGWIKTGPNSWIRSQQKASVARRYAFSMETPPSPVLPDTA